MTLDTTRADRLGCYGHMLADTPNLDRLASEGTRFGRAYASAPLTIPSHSTIFTGRHPPTHGVRDNGDYLLGEAELTLAERFAAAGWTTAAFTSAFPTQARWGFSQGFDVYHDPLPGQPTELDWSDERPADEVVDDAIATLANLPGTSPVFVWVHLFDAHWPYHPPEPFRSQHPGQPYDGEIAFVDSQVGRLLQWWDQAHTDSVVVVTADHGEGLGDGGERTHGFLLHDGTLRVPLLLRTHGNLPGGNVPISRVEHDPVSHVDIAPTLLNLAGLPLDDRLQGRDLRDGGSAVVFSEATTGWLGLGLAHLRAWTGVEGRYTEGTYGAFYPAIGDMVQVQATGATAAQGAALSTLEGSLGDRREPNAAMDPETVERLAALGYLGGVVTDSGSIDPRDVIDVIPLTWEARQAIGRGRLKVAASQLTRLEERLAGSHGVLQLRAQLTRAQGQLTEAYEQFVALYLDHRSSTTALQLARLAEQLGDVREAEGWYTEALALQPMSPEAMGGLVRSEVALGHYEQAQALAERFLRLFPDHGELRLANASIALAEGRVEDAAQEAEAGLQALSRSRPAWLLSARCQWELGNADVAIERLRVALAQDPWALDVRLILAGWLLEVGRNAEAVRVLEPAWQALPEDPAVAALVTAADAALELERMGKR